MTFRVTVSADKVMTVLWQMAVGSFGISGQDIMTNYILMCLTVTDRYFVTSK